MWTIQTRNQGKDDCTSDTALLEEQSKQSRYIQSSKARPIWWYVHILLALFQLAVVWVSVNQRARTTSLIEGKSSWSPELEKLPKLITKFSGSFLSSSAYRGLPSPELDAEWDRFTYNPWIDGTSVILNVSEEDIRHSGKLSDNENFNSTVRLPDSAGGGYMATLEIFHQMHCLNLLRKSTFMEYYADKEMVFMRGPSERRNHLDHCIEILRQEVMCNSDTGLITFHWTSATSTPYPDFNTWHTCRNADADLAWAKANAAPVTYFVTKSAGIEVMPTPP